MLVDTHCHVQALNFSGDLESTIREAKDAGVTRLLCISTSAADSKQAVDLAGRYEEVWAVVGLHPHDAKGGEKDIEIIESLASSKGVVAIGECGLDYYYKNSPKEDQKKMLIAQLELAKKYSLPLSLHIRGSKEDPADAFTEFFDIYDETYSMLDGVVHSFSASREILSMILERNLYVGVNGIATFAREAWQVDAFRAIPIQKMLLETDTPFLTPIPFRGKINTPKHIKTIAEFLASIREETFEEISKETTKNAIKLFGLDHELTRT